MIEAMRWFGPDDAVSLADIRQSGATGVVTALHHLPIDQAWTAEDVRARRELIEAAGLSWEVVESIPVHDAVKRGAPAAAEMTDLWIASLEAAAAGGVSTVCYNFMPLLDWTRTNLDHRLPSGATCLRFDADVFAAFDLHVLKRPGAEADHPPERRERAKKRADAFTQTDIDGLCHAIISGLPGGMSGGHSLDGLREAIGRYAGVDHDALLGNIIAFQQKTAPVAQRLGVRLAIHPDDPPRPLLGLPRAVSTRQDFRRMFEATPSPANGLTWCLGSLSAGAPADALAIGADHAERIHFAHLRVVAQDPDDPASFQEDDHLGGAVSLIDAVALVLAEERRRGAPIPMRPDHGWRMMDDLHKNVNPGYGGLGRMRGLAELRGAAAVLSRPGVLDLVRGAAHAR